MENIAIGISVTKQYLFRIKMFAQAIGMTMACVGNAYSASGLNSGSSLTTGPSSNHHSIYGAFANPAMNSLMIAEDDYWRVSYLPSFSITNELGEADNFTDDLDDLIDLIEDPDSLDEDADEILERFNRVVEEIGETGYTKTSAAINAPLLPLFYKADILGGNIGVDFSYNVQVGTRVLDSEILLDSTTNEITTSTSIYLKSGLEKKLSVSYGRQFFANMPEVASKGSFFAGVKVNFISLDLSKQVIPLVAVEGRDVSDIISDEYDNNVKSNTALGIDIGMVWDADKYRVGFVIENINSPSFNYGVVGRDCDDKAPGFSQDSCAAAQFFVDVEGRIQANEKHTRDALARIDGLFKVTDRWVLSSSYDLAKYNDVSAFENQWFHLSTSYQTQNFWIPAARLGYQKNLAGISTSNLSFGISLFKYLNLDFEYGLEDVTIDGDTIPRRLGFALSVQETF